MRITKGKLSKSEMGLGTELAEQYGVDDPGFVHDAIIIYRTGGKGLPTASSVLAKQFKMKKERGASDEFNKQLLDRQAVLESIVLTTCPDWPEMSPLRAVEKLLIHMRDSTPAAGTVLCGSCSLIRDCGFGKQFRCYSGNGMRFTMDWDCKTDPRCPAGLGGLSPKSLQARLVSLAAAIAKYRSGAALTAEERRLIGPRSVDSGIPRPTGMFGFLHALIEAQGAGDTNQSGSRDSPTFRGGTFAGDLLDLALKKMNVQKLGILHLAKKFSTKLGLGSEETAETSPIVSDKDRTRSIESFTELQDATPGEMVHDDESFIVRAAKGLTRVRKYVRTKDEVSLLYLLLDMSGSMQGFTRSGFGSMYTRSAVSTALTIALAEKVKLGGGFMYARGFPGNQTILQRAEDDRSFEELKKWAFLSNFPIPRRFSGSSV